MSAQLEQWSGLVAVIPARNEEKSIGATIEEILLVIPDSLIIVVDNNSTDKTAEIARRLGATVVFEPTCGKGVAIRTAMEYLPKFFKALFIVDGDATYEIAPLKKSLEYMKNTQIDMVVGVRVSEAHEKHTYRKGHVVGNRLLTFLGKKLHARQVNDSLSGWRLLSHRFVGTFPCNSTGFEIETELNSHARNFDLNVTNVEVLYRKRTENSFSKLNTFSDGRRILLSNFKIVFQNRPMYFIGAPSVSAILISLPLIIKALRGYINTGIVSFLPSLIVGISLLFSGVAFFAIGYVLEQLRRIHISVVRQNYMLRNK
jgi:glycosyltransferase involved in cell wall biosynthesis